MKEIEYLKKYLPKDKLEKGLKELKEGRPVQYIVGNVDFYNVNLLVNENVLIPRFETEYLVEKTINYAKNLKEPLDILDIGTGTGAIAISLAKNLSCIILHSNESTHVMKMLDQPYFDLSNGIVPRFSESNLAHFVCKHLKSFDTS